MSRRQTPGQFFSEAALTVIVGVPLVIALVVWGGPALIWILERLPQDYQ